MNTTVIVNIVLCLMFLIMGISALVTGKPRGNYSKYTTESVKKYSAFHGVILILTGLCLLAYWIVGIVTEAGTKITQPRLVLLIAVFALLLVLIVLRIAIPKKIGSGRSSRAKIDKDEDDR